MASTSNQSDLTEATRLILAGEPPLAIRKHFKSFREAVRFYANFRSLQYGFGVPAEKCCGCDQPAVDVVAEIQWAAAFSDNSIGRVIFMVLALLVHVHIGSKKEWISFSSFHGFCPTCWRRFRQRRFASGYIEALTVLMTLGAAAFAAGFGTAPLVLDHLSSTSRIELWLACAGCVVIAILGLVIRIGYRQWGVPASIRPVAPRPFQLMRTLLMKKVVLPGSPPQVLHIPRYRPANRNAMSWQQTVGVLLTIFGAIPALVLAFAKGMTAFSRSLGYALLVGWLVLVVVLTAWHQKRQKKIRDDYYAGMVARMRSPR